MSHLFRLTVGAAAAAASLMATAGAAHAQVGCDTLPNPIFVSGSAEFEPVLQQFAAKISAEPSPTTIIVVAGGGQSTSCAAIAGLVNVTDFGGLPGRYYTLNGSAIVTNSCMIPVGRTTDVAISDVFYESCTNVPQPKPAQITDTLGPAQAAVFVVPPTSKLTHLTFDEAKAIYGCGVSADHEVAGLFADPTHIFCRDPNAGTQVTVARNIGLPESMLLAPRCTRLNNDGTLVFNYTKRLARPPDPQYDPPGDALGFVAAGALDRNRQVIVPIAFRASGQTLAYYADSNAGTADRRNVRDGHYPLWGYVHLISRTNAGALSAPASELVGWLNGTKVSPNLDYVALEAGASLIPQCAMKVKRASDGGLISPYSPPQNCTCAFEALTGRAIPAGCTPCPSAASCGCGMTCRHGFCE